MGGEWGETEREGGHEGLRDCVYVCAGVGVCVCACVDAGDGGIYRVRYVMHYYLRLCYVLMFHVSRFEPHTHLWSYRDSAN